MCLLDVSKYDNDMIIGKCITDGSDGDKWKGNAGVILCYFQNPEETW